METTSLVAPVAFSAISFSIYSLTLEALSMERDAQRMSASKRKTEAAILRCEADDIWKDLTEYIQDEIKAIGNLALN